MLNQLVLKAFCGALTFSVLQRGSAQIIYLVLNIPHTNAFLRAFIYLQQSFLEWLPDVDFIRYRLSSYSPLILVGKEANYKLKDFS